ncbi:MAG: type II secretion system inner membrane protein GspF [Rhodanobacteraceae bacterium]|nr:type II secretion system inner membrane protein GspF [Rhodanobacteraceae bacterium]MBK7043643.1 type II secretion system inner membrane protein GspF [Rhodanobacteraceae bacterium]MBP9155412.1 type II secretion system inner membrane protein GspF [Xanthomonadales bacterium]HQW80836.1 type II secretion system inner membrane protein GspF [Pseudomonadota bacterium]
MAAFQYQALDATGQEQRGVVDADTARSARQQLRDRGLHPVSVEAAVEAAGGVVVRRGLGTSRLAVFTQQLATLLGAGLPIDEALGALADETDDLKLRHLVAALRGRVREGRSLAAALAEFPESFDELYIATVTAGESSGRLDGALHRLAEYADQRDSLQREVWTALAYPVLLLIVATAVVTGLMTSVVPKVIDVFENLGRDLPWLTVAMVSLSRFLSAWGLWLGLALALFITFALGALQRPAVRARVDALMLRLPGLGRLLRAMDTARATRTLAVLVSSGVPVLDAIKLSVGTVRREPMRVALRQAAVRVREGATLARALGEHKAMPPVALRLIGSGEKSGQLATMLEAAAAQQSREVRTHLSVVAAILGPVVILLVGAVVLAIVLAILLPIFELNSLVGRA